MDNSDRELQARKKRLIELIEGRERRVLRPDEQEGARHVLNKILDDFSTRPRRETPDDGGASG